MTVIVDIADMWSLRLILQLICSILMLQAPWRSAIVELYAAIDQQSRIIKEMFRFSVNF